MKKFLIITLIFLISGQIHLLKGQKTDMTTNRLPAQKFSNDDRVRYYVYPQRILWTSADSGAQIDGAEYLISSQETQVTLEQPPCCILTNTEGSAAILLDFGKELHGSIQIMVGQMKDKTPVAFRVRFGESATEAMSDPGSLQNATNDHAVRDLVVHAPWLGTVEIGNTGFRFVRLDLLDSNRTVPLIGVRAVFLLRNLEYLGSFRCNDARLNQIWETGAYTVHLCMQDFLWDGIKRDRLVWIGDMHPETMTILSVFGGHPIVPASLNLVRRRTPLPKWMNGISSYSMWWLLIQADWYLYSGDVQFLHENKDYIFDLLEQLVECIDSENREQMPAGRFLDWPSNANPPAIHAGLHALLTLTLEAGSGLCQVLEAPEQAQKYAQAAARLRTYIPEPNSSKQAAALMSLAGLADAGKLNESVMAVGGAQGMSTFYGYYVLQARALAGDYQGCLDTIRDYWGGMLDLGATTFWEDFDLAWAKNATRIDELAQKDRPDIHGDFGNYCYKGFRHSLCHGWASGPTAWLSEHVLGIRPLEPGFKSVAITPHLGNLQWVEGTFPTPLGVISVRHEKQPDGSVHSEIHLPEGMVRR